MEHKIVKNLVRALLIPAIVLCALSSAHAQTTKFNAVGSSALFLELGEATYTANHSTVANAAPACVGSGAGAKATDTSTGTSLSDSGNAWAVWVPAISGNILGSTGKVLGHTYYACSDATQPTPSKVYGYLQTDSVVGNRCLFNAINSASCTLIYPTTTPTNANLIATAKNLIVEVPLPPSVATSLTGLPNAAGTDIRPEDAEFATTRALTPCGATEYTSGGTTYSIAPYLGLGYNAGDKIHDGFGAGKSFNVIPFSLSASYNVQSVGIDPMIVAINSTDAPGTGLSDTHITSISKLQLAEYLDGSVGSSAALIPVGIANVDQPVTTIIREPLSGTYNTMEYNVPNSVSLQTSQDVGALQPAAQQNCSGSSVGSYSLNAPAQGEGTRIRAIGTGQEVSKILATNDSLGYAFWGVSNFAAAGSSTRYLAVDGIDPLHATYLGGAIPTAAGTTTATALSSITFNNVKNGTYPIWSMVRLVTADSASAANAKILAIGAAKFSTGTTSPDFVPYYNTLGAVNVHVVRSHFTPPGINFTATPANGFCSATEVGGDVGGVIIPNVQNFDTAYCTDTTSTTGVTGRRY